MWRLFFAIVGAVVALAGDCTRISEIREGRLEVLATDVTGERISEMDIELTPVDDALALVRLTSTSTLVRYGAYRARIHAQGFIPVERLIQIDQPETTVRLELQVGSLGCPDPPAEISGRIKRNGNDGELWVKAVTLRGVGGAEARVSKQGYFLISGLKDAAYVVMVLHDDLLHQRIVRTYSKGRINRAEVEIDLAQTPYRQ